MSFQDHFSTQATGYARSRPTYPAALFAELARLAPSRALAWDAGTGNGQAAVALAAHFTRVAATEPSAQQLAEAVAHARVEYYQAAEQAPMLADSSVDLVTAAQAAHWFDRTLFFSEVRRVAKPDAIIALWSYPLCITTPEIDAAVYHFYDAVVGQYWPLAGDSPVCRPTVHPEAGGRLRALGRASPPPSETLYPEHCAAFW